jgi:hypothetical protein
MSGHWRAATGKLRLRASIQSNAHLMSQLFIQRYLNELQLLRRVSTTGLLHLYLE